MTNTGGSTIPAKEFEGKLWILADAYQQAMQAAYIGGVLAEREACAALCDKIADDDGFEGGYADYCAQAIRKRGQE